MIKINPLITTPYGMVITNCHNTAFQDTTNSAKPSVTIVMNHRHRNQPTNLCTRGDIKVNDQQTTLHETNPSTLKKITPGV